jgi:FdhD protein
MPRAKSLLPIAITRLAENAAPSAADDSVAVEEPLEIRIGGQSIAVVMRTPGHDRELAAGFLVSEGIVRRRDDLLDIVYCQPAPGDSPAAPEAAPEENVLNVLLAPGATVDLTRLTRHVFTSSSCGICSKATIDAVRATFPPLAQTLVPKAAVLVKLPDRLRAVQRTFAATGGLHASAIFTTDGTLVIAREDVGRHNAVDKVVGHAFLAGELPLRGHILLVSGRVSFELVQKALAAGIPCLAAISAPTSAAVAFARDTGQTLVGFLRDGRMNVYAGCVE